MPPIHENGWERWRGEINARVDDTEESVKAFWLFKEQADRRIVAMETKIVIFAALAAAAGSMLPGVIASIFGK